MIRHEVIELSVVSAAMQGALNKQAIKFEDCYRCQYKPGANFFEPINGDPFVVVLGEEKATKHVFAGQAHSGTDKLRARIEAQAFFDRLKATETIRH